MRRFKALIAIMQSGHLFESLAKELLSQFSDQLSEDDNGFLIAVSNYRSSLSQKVILLKNQRIYTKRVSKNITIIFRILLNHF